MMNMRMSLLIKRPGLNRGSNDAPKVSVIEIGNYTNDNLKELYTKLYNENKLDDCVSITTESPHYISSQDCKLIKYDVPEADMAEYDPNIIYKLMTTTGMFDKTKRQLSPLSLTNMFEILQNKQLYDILLTNSSGGIMNHYPNLLKSNWVSFLKEECDNDPNILCSKKDEILSFLDKSEGESITFDVFVTELKRLYPIKRLDELPP